MPKIDLLPAAELVLNIRIPDVGLYNKNDIVMELTRIEASNYNGYLKDRICSIMTGLFESDSKEEVAKTQKTYSVLGVLASDSEIIDTDGVSLWDYLALSGVNLSIGRFYGTASDGHMSPGDVARIAETLELWGADVKCVRGTSSSLNGEICGFSIFEGPSFFLKHSKADRSLDYRIKDIESFLRSLLDEEFGRGEFSVYVNYAKRAIEVFAVEKLTPIAAHKPIARAA